MNVWLTKALEAIHVSPGSPAAAAVQKQLQESGLLQHLGTRLDAAATHLKVKAQLAASCKAAVQAVTSDPPSITAVSTPIMELSRVLLGSDRSCAVLLRTFQLASCVLSPTRDFSMEVVLPAVPAAARLVLSVFQTHSKIQELGQQPMLQHGPLQVAYNICWPTH